MTLPTNIDASYPDRSAGDAVHQQHHDAVHAFYNKFDHTAAPAAGNTWVWDATAGVYKPASSGASVKATLPCAVAEGFVLSTTIAAVTRSWFYLDPNHISGVTEYRAVALSTGATASDVIGVDLYDAQAAAVLLAEFTATATGTTSLHIASAWTPLPAAIKRGYFRARNQTGARGAIQHCWIELR